MAEPEPITPGCFLKSGFWYLSIEFTAHCNWPESPGNILPLSAGKNAERNAERIAQELDKIFRCVKEVDAKETEIFSNKMYLSRAEFTKENIYVLIKEVNDGLKEKQIPREKATDIKNSLRRRK